MTTATLPTTPAELAEVLNDTARMKEHLATRESTEKFIQGYADQFAQRDQGETAAQAREQMQLVLAEYLKENRAEGADGARVSMAGGQPRIDGLGLSQSIDASYYQARKNKLYNKAAPGAAVDHLFGTASEFMRALSIRCGALNTQDDGLMGKLSESVKIQNSFGTDVPSDGGFLLPEGFRSDLLMVELEESLIRQRATVIPMDTERVTIPAVDSTSNVSSVYGGITVSWVDESTQGAESSAKFAAVTLDAKKVMAYCKAPNELVASQTAFGAFLDQALPGAMAFETDYRFMQGTGVGEPLGFINSDAAIIASADSGQGAGTITVPNLANMFCRMFPASLSKAIWIADIGAFPQLAQLSVPGTLGNSSPVWMNNGSIADAPPISIYGRPVFFTEKCPALGTTGDINFVDPRFYLIGDRQMVTASASPHFAFNVDMTAYKVIMRLDGRPWIAAAITPKNGGNTLSFQVQLSSTRT